MRVGNRLYVTKKPRITDDVICPALTADPQGIYRPLTISAPDGVHGVLIVLYGYLAMPAEGLDLVRGECVVGELPGGFVIVKTRDLLDAMLEGKLPERYLSHWTQDAATLCQMACRACEFEKENLFVSFRASIAQLLPNSSVSQQLIFLIVIGAVMMTCASLVGAEKSGVKAVPQSK